MKIDDVEEAAWISKLAHAEIVRKVGEGAFHRGQKYFQDGHVINFSITGNGNFLTGELRGSRAEIYQTMVFARQVGTTVRWDGTCSCPMTRNCKHTAALLLAAQDALENAGKEISWQEALGELLVREPVIAYREIALEVADHTQEIDPWGGAGITLLPLIRGKNGWIRKGVSWAAIMGSGDATDLISPPALSVLRELAALAPGGTLYYADDRLNLSQLPAHVWELLRRAVDAGITLTTAQHGGRAVQIVEGVRAGLCIDRADDGAVVITPEVDYSQCDFSPLGLSGADAARDLYTPATVGEPVHAFAVAHLSGQLLLLPLAEALSPAMGRLLREEHPQIVVPAAEVADFEDEYFAPVLKQTPVLRVDAALNVPEPTHVQALLRLRVDSQTHRLETAWSLLYLTPTGEVKRERAIASLHAQDFFADAFAEEERVILEVFTLLTALEPWRLTPLQPGTVRSAQSSAAALLPHSYEGMGTARFVTEVLPILQECPDVAVEIVGELPDYRQATELPVISTDISDDDGADWFSLQVKIQVGEEAAPLERVMQALAAGEREILLDSGTWVKINTPQIARLAELMEAGRELADPGPHSSLHITPFQAGYFQQLVDLGVVGQTAQRWNESVEKLLEITGEDSAEALTEVAVPAGLQAQLRPYQLEGYRWLYLLHSTGLGGILADDMGLGKTVQVLAVIQQAVERSQAEGRDRPAPVLVVAPTSVVGSWVEQAAKFCPELVVRPLTSTAKKRGTTLAAEAEGADIVVTSYTLTRIDEEAFTAQEWSWVVLDEAQFVKNHNAATYKAVRRLQATSTVAITGTPLENSLMDLWAIFSISAPGLLPGPDKFKQSFKKPIDKGNVKQLEALRQLMHPFMLRRTKEQVAADLPSKTEQILPVELGPDHRRAYEQRLSRERQKVLGLLENDSPTARFSALKSLTTLRQMALDPALVETDPTARHPRSAKVSLLLEHLEPVVAEGHRALVFSQFTRYLSSVREQLDAAGLRTLYLDGTTTNRQEVIENFRAGQADVFLISLKAGGFGLTLTEADYVYLLDPWWNPQAEEQAVDRAHRIGQENPVMVYRLVSSGTIEEKVMALKEKKAELFDRVVESAADGEASAMPQARSRAALSAAEIRDLIA